MCGRYTVPAGKGVLERAFAAQGTFDFAPRYNVAPTQQVPIVRAANETRELLLARWGLVPAWVRDPKDLKATLINARAESAAEKPSFRKAFKTRRCLVPAGGFFEWPKRGGERHPFYLRAADVPLMAFAGLYEMWEGGDEPLLSCTVLTTTPNAAVAALHDRMPVILSPEHYSRWLDPATPLPDALELLRPFAGPLHAHRVGSAVNSPKSSGPGLVLPA